MKFRTRLYLFTTILIVFTTFSVLFSGMAIIDEIIFQLNERILFLELNRVVSQINEAYDVLKESGLADVKAYRDSVKKELEEKFERYRLGNTGRICILNEKGRSVIKANSFNFTNKALKKMFTNQEGAIGYLKNDKGDSKFCVYSASKFKWRVVLLADRSELFSKRDLYYQVVAIIGLCALLGALTVSYVFSHRLSNQISEILLCLKKVAKGDLNTQINIAPFSNEHNELRHGINSMIGDLRKRENERKKSEDEMIKHQKLESLSILAGGIAHDFNNILTAIRGNIQLGLMYDMNPELRQCLDDSEKATVRAMELTNQLLTFSKGGAPVRKASSIEDILTYSGSFILRGTGAKCEFDFSDDLKAVNIDSSQISQVIDNIIINANQSMPDGGIVDIKAENTYIGSDSSLPLLEGEYVKISIRDHGKGIEKQNLSRIFDPFFTTKSTGTGLGLSSSYAIVKKHGGHIEVESEIGKGSVFKIYLPVSNEEIFSNIETENAEFKGGGKVLIMDDQESIRRLLGKMLNMMNCECGFAENGQVAYELYKNAMDKGQPYDLVFMDLTIPGGMGGKETLATLLEVDPDVKAVVASGYVNDPVMANYTEYGFRGRLEKPFKVNDLKALMSRLIDS